MAAARVNALRRHLVSASSSPTGSDAAHVFPIRTSLADQRNCAAGHVVADGNGYYDSQNLSRDPRTGRLCCVFHWTRNHEGGPGLRLYSTVSDDDGVTWSAPVPLEKSLTRPSHDGYQLRHPDPESPLSFCFYGYQHGSLHFAAPTSKAAGEFNASNVSKEIADEATFDASRPPLQALAVEVVDGKGPVGKHGIVALPRADMQARIVSGATDNDNQGLGFCVRASLDGGKSFGGPGRFASVPIRQTRIDRENPLAVMNLAGVFCCDKPQLIWESSQSQQKRPTVMFAFQKTREGGGETPYSEVFFMRSRDFLDCADAGDVSRATWETLPRGDTGLSCPAEQSRLVIGEEPHIIQVIARNSSRLFSLWRSTEGALAASYSSDGGDSWDKPFWLTYAGRPGPGLQVMRNPRGSITPYRFEPGSEFGDNCFVLLYYNNAHTDKDGYVGRRCYFLSMGWTSSSSLSSTSVIEWSQPELALWWDGETQLDEREGWNADWAIVDGAGYPDFVEIPFKDGGRRRLCYVESNKLTVRFHEVDRRSLLFLSRQRSVLNGEVEPKFPRSGLMFSWREGQSSFCRTPRLPDLRSGSGYTILLWLQSAHAFDASKPPSGGREEMAQTRQVLVDATSEVTATLDEQDAGTTITKGYTITVAHRGPDGLQLSLSVRDGFGKALDITTDSAGGSLPASLLFDGEPHLVAFIVDGSARVGMSVVDRSLCDGGRAARQGWTKVPDGLGECGGGETRFLPSPTEKRPHAPFAGRVLSLDLFARPLLVSECIEAWKAGRRGPP